MDDLCRPTLQPGERKTECVLGLVNLMMAETAWMQAGTGLREGELSVDRGLSMDDSINAAYDRAGRR
jgi:hypothetical protein